MALDSATQQLLDSRLQAGVELGKYAEPSKPGGFIEENKQSPFLPANVGNALGNRMQRMYEQDINKLATQQELANPIKAFKQSGTNFELSMKKQQHDYMTEYNARKRKMQEDQLRANTLASVLGAVGMGVGMYFGAAGGPAGMAGGAMAGQKLGQGLGQAGSQGGF